MPVCTSQPLPLLIDKCTARLNCNEDKDVCSWSTISKVPSCLAPSWPPVLSEMDCVTQPAAVVAPLQVPRTLQPGETTTTVSVQQALSTPLGYASTAHSRRQQQQRRRRPPLMSASCPFCPCIRPHQPSPASFDVRAAAPSPGVEWKAVRRCDCAHRSVINVGGYVRGSAQFCGGGHVRGVASVLFCSRFTGPI